MEDLSNEEIEIFKACFRVFDDTGEGTISIREIRQVALKLGCVLSEDDIQDRINEIDLDGNGTLEFNEFTSAMLDKMKSKTDDELRAAFRIYAIENPYFITSDSLRHVFGILGQQLKDEELDEMMREADFDYDGLISYDDFVAAMSAAK